jgi:hypothetical protein
MITFRNIVFSFFVLIYSYPLTANSLYNIESFDNYLNRDIDKYSRLRNEKEMKVFDNNTYQKLFQIKDTDLQASNSKISKRFLKYREIIDFEQINCKIIDGKVFDEYAIEFFFCPVKKFKLNSEILNLFNTNDMVIKKYNNFHLNNAETIDTLCIAPKDSFYDGEGDLLKIYYNMFYLLDNNKCNNPNFKKDMLDFLTKDIVNVYNVKTIEKVWLGDISGSDVVVEIDYNIFVNNKGDYRIFYISLSVGNIQ